MSAPARGARDDGRQLTAAGVLLGVGFGAFFDGIVLHQILQWHHMFSSTGRWQTTTLHGLKVNTLGDGLFHAAAWLISLAGLTLLWRARGAHARWSGRAFVGLLLLGWGAFNLVEGLIDHELLGIHHVRSGAQHRAWDAAFLAWGALMAAAGLWLARRDAGAALARPRGRA